MATPAARPNPQSPNFQRHTAGSCTLDIETQPSALSQWSAKPIAKALSFQLWLHEGDFESLTTGPESAEPQGTKRLIAAGDRTDLQSLSQYFQQQTQQVLAIANMAGFANAALSTRASHTATASPPSILQISAPLSYLQLSDINSVISQYEQATRTLPVDLGIAPSVETLPEAARKASPPATNVISLSDARRQRTLGPAQRQTAQRQTVRRMRGAWASSAAVALFAVGLTTTLVSRNPSLQKTNVTLDTVPESLDEDFAAESAAPSAAEPSTSQESSAAQSVTEDLNTVGESATGLQTDSQRTQTAASASRQSADQLPTNDRAVEDRAVENRAVEDRAIAENPPESAPAEVPISASNTENESTVADSSPSPVPERSQSAASQRDIAQNQPQAVAPATASSTPAPRVEQESRIERATSEPFSLPPSASAAGQSAPDQSTSDQSPEVDTQRTSRERIFAPSEPARSAEALSRAPVPSAAPVISQVQTYFQQRWEGSATDTLTYRLQLNAAGEVISFIGLDDASQAERDRRLPTDAPPVFDLTTAEETPVLRILLRQDGTVEVTPF